MNSRKKRRGSPADSPVEEPAWYALLEGQKHPDASPADSKLAQLCRQVEQAVSCALAAAMSPLLRDLAVVGVESIRGAAQLRVLVALDDDDRCVAEVDEALARAAGYLRTEVACAIHRKRAPALSFAVVPPGHGSDGDGV